MSSRRTMRIVAADGTALHGELSEHPRSDVTAVLLHGFGENSAVWLDTRNSLSELCSVFTLDLRGHGDSAASPNGQYSRELYVSDVLGAIQHLALQRIVLVGHSMGAWIAAHVAALRPGLVSALTLVDISPNTTAKIHASVIESLLQRLRPYASVAEYREWLGNNRQLLSEATLDQLAHASLRPTESGFELKLDPALARQGDLGLRPDPAELFELLQAIPCPAQVIRGGASAFLSSASAKAIAAQFRQSQLVTIPRAGHGVMNDNPTAFIHALRQFLEPVAA